MLVARVRIENMLYKNIKCAQPLFIYIFLMLRWLD